MDSRAYEVKKERLPIGMQRFDYVKRDQIKDRAIRAMKANSKLDAFLYDWAGVPILTVGFIFAPLFDWMLSDHLALGMRLLMTVLFIGSLIYLVNFKKNRAFLRALHAELLKEKMEPTHCIMCGYDLQGAVGVNCPECGAAFRVDESSGDL